MKKNVKNSFVNLPRDKLDLVSLLEQLEPSEKLRGRGVIELDGGCARVGGIEEVTEWLCG